jgi:hypothetical protein
MLQAEFSANAEKAARVKAKTPVIQGNCNWHSGCNRSSVVLESKRDLKNRERFGWTDDDAKADWPHAAGAYRRIESANKGRRGERHARLERSQLGRPGCHSLPRSMSNRRHLPRPMFPLYIQLDRQRAEQRVTKVAAAEGKRKQ